MEQLIMEVRRLVYTVICFQCLLQIVSGSAYRKYLKLFSYILTLCMCCSVICSFVGQIDDNINSAQVFYDKWEREWTSVMDIDRINESSSYYRDKIWNEKILNDAYSEYGDSSINGGAEDVGKAEKYEE